MLWTAFNMLTVIRLNAYKKALDDYKDILLQKGESPELTEESFEKIVDSYNSSFACILED